MVAPVSLPSRENAWTCGMLRIRLGSSTAWLCSSVVQACPKTLIEECKNELRISLVQLRGMADHRTVTSEIPQAKEA